MNDKCAAGYKLPATSSEPCAQCGATARDECRLASRKIDEDLTEAHCLLSKQQREIERLKNFVDFVNKWLYRDGKVTTDERLNVIQYHPIARERARETGWVNETDADAPPALIASHKDREG